MSRQILNDVKLYLGSIYAETTDFDEEIIGHINTCFPSLRQINGSIPVFNLETGLETWEQFIEVDYLHLVREYISVKVKINFDPPSNSTVLQSLKDVLSETEFRLYMAGNEKGSD